MRMPDKMPKRVWVSKTPDWLHKFDIEQRDRGEVDQGVGDARVYKDASSKPALFDVDIDSLYKQNASLFDQKILDARTETRRKSVLGSLQHSVQQSINLE